MSKSTFSIHNVNIIDNRTCCCGTEFQASISSSASDLFVHIPLMSIRMFGGLRRLAAQSRALSSLSEAQKIEKIRQGVAPSSGRKLTEIAAEIWGHVRDPAGPGHRSGIKYLKKPLKGPLYEQWYPIPIHQIKGSPVKLTDKQERWQKKLKVLRAAGKGPPKKGSGKRSK